MPVLTSIDLDPVVDAATPFPVTSLLSHIRDMWSEVMNFCRTLTDTMDR